MFGDSAALLGLAVAFLGIFLSVTLQEPRIDGPVVIGALLCLIAGAMVREQGPHARGLRRGEGDLEGVRALQLADAAGVRGDKLLTLGCAR